jgi:hypothetical protein
MKGLVRVPRRVRWLTLGAVLLYGALAAWANRAHGDGAMLRAAAVQGLSCGVTTLGLSTLIDRGIAAWVQRGRTLRGSAAITAGAAVALGTGLHAVVNLWAGTPELLATLAWPVAALAVYCPLYAAAAVRRGP